jgi:hypothetical protein
MLVMFWRVNKTPSCSDLNFLTYFLLFSEEISNSVTECASPVMILHFSVSIFPLSSAATQDNFRFQKYWPTCIFPDIMCSKLCPLACSPYSTNLQLLELIVQWPQTWGNHHSPGLLLSLRSGTNLIWFPYSQLTPGGRYMPSGRMHVNMRVRTKMNFRKKGMCFCIWVGELIWWLEMIHYIF